MLSLHVSGWDCHTSCIVPGESLTKAQWQAAFANISKFIERIIFVFEPKKIKNVMTEETSEPVFDTCSGIPLNVTLKYTGGCWNGAFPLPALPGAGEEGLGETHRPVFHAEWNEQNLAGSGWVHTVHWPDILKSGTHTETDSFLSVLRVTLCPYFP